jgi:kinesin family protein 6/9
LVPRIFSKLFEEISGRANHSNGGMHFNVYVSYFEIYNECGYDLLDRKHAETPFEKWNKITLQEDNNGNLHLRNLTVH